MKREFLEGLGLNKEQTDAVMSEYGKGLEALKLKIAELEGININVTSAPAVTCSSSANIRKVCSTASVDTSIKDNAPQTIRFTDFFI